VTVQHTAVLLTRIRKDSFLFLHNVLSLSIGHWWKRRRRKRQRGEGEENNNNIYLMECAGFI
jgi:hypothetical protein